MLATIFRWLVTGTLGLFWASTTISNIVDLVNTRRHGGSTSLVLFFGGIAGAVALLVCPLPGTGAWAWIPALLDPGCIPAALLILVAVLRGQFKEGKDD